jgi:hypothetical protein
MSLNPNVVVLLASGTADENDPRRRAPANGSFLSKPYTAEALLSELHRLRAERPKKK